MEKLKEFFNKSFGVIQNLLFHEYQSANPCNFHSEKMHGVQYGIICDDDNMLKSAVYPI